MRKKGRLCIGIVLILMLGLSLPCFMCSAKIKPKEQMYGWVNNNKNTIQLNKKATDSMIGKTSKQKLKNASDVSALKKLIACKRLQPWYSYIPWYIQIFRLKKSLPTYPARN